ncbi:conserved hypothetical protein [Parafrankia sp. Ea1.12]|uniref:DUF2786 domain-containing protein n=1 Tax=Parafrankia sp. Ea1.12 TaxID=573499 RepID=UPI000DA43682|nr:DUF2786 domain-containing protein [Parafrankia sp. Ea1.12]SQD99855.1 conserved hypothetical protein [Parafrankia sp. Ea1.12]
MSTRNREKRRAKQKARAERGRAAAAGPGSRYDREREQRELSLRSARALIAAALDAHDQGDDAALANHLASLATPPGGAGGHRIVNTCLDSLLDGLVEMLWEAGWQPADLHRVVSRRAGVRVAALAVDAVAAQMRQYAPSTVDERWTGQLRALDATVWWGDDDHWLDAWGARHGRGRPEVLGDAVELVNLLRGLPVIQMLGPVPGTARRGGAGGAGGVGSGSGGVDQGLLDKVRALLAKAESTSFAEEAEALTAKAQQLMARHSIDEALLAAQRTVTVEPIGRRIGIDNPYEAAKAILLNVIAGANRCHAVWAKHLGSSTVVGYPSDIDAVELLYTSLLVQATTAMTHAGTRQDRHGRSRTRSFRQSFLTAFATRIGERLRVATEQASAQAVAEAGDPRLLPVLASRDESVRAAVAAMFPEIVEKSVSGTDREGLAFGRAAADLATLRIRDEVAGSSSAPAGSRDR